MKYIALLLFVPLVLQAGALHRCDCTERTGTCRAGVGVDGNLLTLTADTPQCAEVLFYIDGHPNVALVTDGRAVQKRLLQAGSSVVVGRCHTCQQMSISMQQRIESALDCPPELLMSTPDTNTCLQECRSVSGADNIRQCERTCHKHSSCLDKNCVESLSRTLQSCQRDCDREMQSSIAADIDTYNRCVTVCNKIKDDILSCPVL